MIEIGTLLQDRYLIEKKIGAGGMGAVYLAVDNRFDNYVAIKETFYNDEEFGEAFEREAKLLNSLHHPGLPHVSDYFTENNTYFLVMQYIEGEDLSDILKREHSFPVETVMRWTKSLLDALGYLHSQTPPIIHRDIKPHNLKLTPRGDIMLLDFGLAKADYDEKNGAVSVFGYSRTYSPLEQIQGTGTDERSDIFALSATVYHLLTGKPPVDALARAAAIVNGKTDPIQLASELKSEIPAAFASILNSGLALNPENRFISVDAMRQAFEYAIDEDSKNETTANESAPPIVAEPLKPIMRTAEDGNFPALEAFAAEIEKNPAAVEPANDRQIIPVLPNSDVRETVPSSDSPPPSVFAETPTEVSIRTKNNFKPRLWAILAAALVFGVIAALYLSGRDNSPVQTNESPVGETTPAVNANKKSSKPGSETVAETKTKPAEKTAEKHNPEGAKNNPVTPDDSEGLSRKKDVPNDDETNLNNSDDEAEPEVKLPENERVNRKDTRRRAERPIPDVMTEEEFQQLQREQKQRRRERRNRPDEF